MLTRSAVSELFIVADVSVGLGWQEFHLGPERSLSTNFIAWKQFNEYREGARHQDAKLRDMG
jgi:hypothetical protein